MEDDCRGFCATTALLGQRAKPSRHRSGSVLLFSLVIMLALLGMCAFAIDWGRAQLAESELQTAVDAAARYGAAGLDSGDAESRVYTSLAEARVDKQLIPADAVTITYYSYDAAAGTFSKAKADVANAIGVSVTLSGANGTEAMFGKLLGVTHVDVAAESVATLHQQIGEVAVGSCNNPWLAGMPAGTVSNPLNPKGNPDYAGSVGSSGTPIGVNLVVSPGAGLAFDSINGGASFDPSLELTNADGYQNNMFSNRFATGRIRPEDEPHIDYNGDGWPDGGWPSKWYSTDNQGQEHGKSDLAAPACSLVAVFLGPDGANVGTVPDQLVFDTKESRDFTVLYPELNQPFFIGDGRTSDGAQQEFVVPAGATTLYLGVMDVYEWNNNQGGFSTVIKQYGKIATVK